MASAKDVNRVKELIAGGVRVPNESVIVAEEHHCDVHKAYTGQLVPAVVDGKTRSGPWGFLCIDCFVSDGVGLGLGKGQALIVKKEAK